MQARGYPVGTGQVYYPPKHSLTAMCRIFLNQITSHKTDNNSRGMINPFYSVISVNSINQNATNFYIIREVDYATNLGNVNNNSRGMINPFYSVISVNSINQNATNFCIIREVDYATNLGIVNNNSRGMINPFYSVISVNSINQKVCYILLL